MCKYVKEAGIATTPFPRNKAAVTAGGGGGFELTAADGEGLQEVSLSNEPRTGIHHSPILSISR